MFYVHHYLGRRSNLTCAYFSNGLKPPTSLAVGIYIHVSNTFFVCLVTWLIAWRIIPVRATSHEWPVGCVCFFLFFCFCCVFVLFPLVCYPCGCVVLRSFSSGDISKQSCVNPLVSPWPSYYHENPSVPPNATPPRNKAFLWCYWPNLSLKIQLVRQYFQGGLHWGWAPLDSHDTMCARVSAPICYLYLGMVINPIVGVYIPIIRISY